MFGVCKVCDSNVSKYKCPTCSIIYCSVACYKRHKENCVKEVTLQNNEEASPTIRDGMANRSYEFETEDTVPIKKLELLKYSSGILSCLKNPHLRDMLKHLNSSSQPTTEIAQAMNEPIFYEFASECLKAVDDDLHLYAEDNADSE